MRRRACLAFVAGALLVTAAPVTTRAALAAVGVNDTGRTAHDRPLVVPAPGVMGNDLDLLGGTTVSLVSGVAHGTLALRSDGGYTYTPAPGYVGADSFRYRPSGLLATAATVSLTVTNAAPIARNDAYSTVGRTTLVVPAPGVLGNDSDADGDALVVELSGGGVSGSLDLEPNGSFVYSPGGGASGSVTFRYRVWDGVAWSPEATVTVSLVAATPTPQPTPTPRPTPMPTPTPAPTPLLPVPNVPAASLPLPLPSVPLPLPLPTPPPDAIPTPPTRPGGSTPSPTPIADDRDGAPDAEPGAEEPPGAAEPGGSPGAGDTPSGRAGSAGSGPGALSPDAAGRNPSHPAADAPEIVFDPASVEFAMGQLALLDGIEIWMVPAATISIPGLLILVWVALQAAGAAAWIPAVRRLRGRESDGARPRSARQVGTGH